MSRLIVISNRVSAVSEAGGASVGGLAMALSSALREYSGIWIGWSGRTVPQFTGQISMERSAGVTIATVDLEEQDRDEYYNGYANRTLWPLFHYRIDLSAYERSFDQGYARVNARFADTAQPLLQPDDFVWVHDYHLIPLGRELRRRGVTNRIGFFLHIPWPARRLFNTLPNRNELVQALFDYDIVGFQTEDSRAAFEEYVTHEAGGVRLPDGRLSAFGRRLRIGAFPIGLDCEGFEAAASSPQADEWRRRLNESLAGRRLLLGVDRLDYSKGLEERFLAYETFLLDHPEALENVSLLQIATPSRDEVPAYQEIRARLDAVSGRINGAFASADWVPIRYVNRSYRRDELAGMYRTAAIGLITPLRDGMNLVAKEFVAAQDPEDPGVLILSQFAGAAEQLRDALIVNPFSREEVSDAIARAMAMGRTERLARWESLIAEVRESNVQRWRDSFVAALRDPEAQTVELELKENGDGPKSAAGLAPA